MDYKAQCMRSVTVCVFLIFGLWLADADATLFAASEITLATHTASVPQNFTEDDHGDILKTSDPIVTAGQDTDHLKKLEEALPLLRELTEIVCLNLPLEGSRLKLSADAEIRLESILKKLVDAGVQGAVDYEKYKNISQEKLAEMKANEQKCRSDVYQNLINNLFPPPPPTGTLKLRSKPSNMSVVIRGENGLEESTSTPISIPLVPGRYRVTLTKDHDGSIGWGYFAVEDIDVELNQTKKLEIVASPVQLAQIILNPLSPGATYFLDRKSKSLGMLQDPKRISVYPGDHKLLKKTAEGGTQEIQFAVVAGEERQISF